MARAKKVTPKESEIEEQEVPTTIPEIDLIEEHKEEGSLLSKELVKFERQIAEIQDTLDDIKLKEVEGVEERLKATIAKIGALQKLPALLSALDDLRNKHLVRADGIKGKDKVLSPLEDGMLDDDDD